MKNQIVKHIGVVVIYTGLVIILTWPVAVNVGTHIAGSGGAPWQTTWRMEEKVEMLSQSWEEGHTIDIIKREFLGQGEARLVNLSVWPWLPIVGLFGVVVGYNIIWLCSFVLAGYGMYLLVSWLIKTYGSVRVDSVSETKSSWNKLVEEAPGFQRTFWCDANSVAAVNYIDRLGVSQKAKLSQDINIDQLGHLAGLDGTPLFIVANSLWYMVCRLF